MRKFLMLFIAICFLSVSCSRGRLYWTWKPDPFEADYNYASILNADGKEIKCTQREFSDFTCFSSVNLAELKFNIERLRISKRAKKKLLKAFSKLTLKRTPNPNQDYRQYR